jgi:hypothetical protein
MTDTKPWVERQKVKEAIEVLQNGEQDWEYLSGEEKYGTVVQAREILDRL